MKKNKIISIIVLSAMLIAQPLSISNVYAATGKQTNVKADGLIQRTEYMPINIEGNIMIEAETLFKIVGVSKYVISPETGRITFYFLNKAIDMQVGKKGAVVNNISMGLNIGPREFEGKIYLPLRFVAERCNIKVGWDGATSTVILDTIAKDYSVIQSVEKNESDENKVYYRLAEAVLLAMKTEKTIEKLDQSILDAQKEIEDIEPAIINSRGRNLDDAYQQVSDERKLQSYYDIISNAEINKKITEKNTEYKFISTMNSIENSEYNIMLLEKNIALEEINIKNMELKTSLGYETDTNVKTAKNNLEQNKISLKNMQTNLKNVKMTLNNSLGVSYDKEVVITYDKDLSKLAVPNLDKYISDKIDKDLNVELKAVALGYQDIVKSTHYSLDSNLRNQTIGAYTEKSENVDADQKFAAKDLEDTKNNLELSMRTAYNNLLLKDEDYVSAKIELDKAVSTYGTAAVSYETGNALIYDVLQAELNLLKAEVALEQNRSSYALEKYCLENPMFLK